MSDVNGAGEPADGVAGGETEEIKDPVTLADDDEVVIDDGDDEEADDDDGEPKPAKRQSRSQRYKDKIARLERELEDRRMPVRRPAPKAEGDELKEPKETDFPNDYLAYDRALRKYEMQKVLRDEAQRGDDAAQAEEAQREFRLRQASYNRHLDEVKDRIPDFDKVMADARNMEVRDDVRDLILESAKGPLMAYHLAKNPDKVDELNRMTPTAAARAIGSLEARIRGPATKAATAAKPSPKPPKGGAGTSTPNLAKGTMSNEEYRAWRAKQT